MADQQITDRRLAAYLALTAFLIPIAHFILVALLSGGVAFWDEAAVALSNGGWTAWPFVGGALAAAWRPGLRRLRGALWLGFGLTAAPWIWLAVDGLVARSGPDGGGANIGIGLVLLAVPVLVALLILGAVLTGSMRRGSGEATGSDR